MPVMFLVQLHLLLAAPGAGVLIHLLPTWLVGCANFAPSPFSPGLRILHIDQRNLCRLLPLLLQAPMLQSFMFHLPG